ncbi:MAG: cytochrome c3 family protein [bacterium]
MNKRASSISVLLFVLLMVSASLVPFPVVQGRTAVKGNMGEVCLDCHPGLKEELGKGIPHKPCASRECISCHSPHVADNEFLLLVDGAELCYGCHPSSRSRADEKVVHVPFEQGECLKCHEPHVSPYADLLRSKGREVCHQCHDREPFQRKHIHKPVEEGNCAICHKAHSASTPFLLHQSSPKLCLGCHPVNTGLISAHPGMQIAAVDCLLCHNPHSSGGRRLVLNYLHDPFEKRDCKACHPISSGRIKPAAGDAKACFACHKDARERFKAKKRSHIVSGQGECIFCHNPHGAERKNLVRRRDKDLCIACHQEMGERLSKVRKGLRRHPEVLAGNCSTCHDAHASNEKKFLRDAPLAVCTACHKRQQVACHPVGDKAVDPRSMTPIDCITCHNPMEAEFPQIMRLEGSKELCNQCHKY